MKDEIQIIGKFCSSSQHSRFFVKSLFVNGKEKEWGGTKNYTKGQFFKLISQIWAKMITGKETTITITITSKD